MVRALLLDETHVEAFVDNLLLSNTTLQVGLAIGRFGASLNRDAVFALIPTPKNDGRDVALLEEESGAESRVSRETEKRRGAKGKPASPSLRIDFDWIGEHARQVSKMLVGGISVVGVYILTNDSTFRNAMPLLFQTAKAVEKAVRASVDRPSLEGPLLLHFSYSPRRTSCRSCSVQGNYESGALRPCEWKSAKILSTLCSFGCSYSFEIRNPVFANKTPKKRLVEVLLSSISMEASRLESAIAVTDGNLVTQNKVLASKTDHEVEFILPYDCGGVVSNGKVAGLAILTGSVRGQAYCFSREPVSHAIADLKADIVKSLRSRLEILLDEVDMSQQDANPTEPALHPLQRIEDALEYHCKLPRRVLVPWFEGVLVSDYMQSGETIQDLNARCKELLGIIKPLNEADVLECETMNTNLQEKPSWDLSTSRSKSEPKLNPDRTQLASLKGLLNTQALWSVLVLLLTCLIGWWLRQHLHGT